MLSGPTIPAVGRHGKCPTRMARQVSRRYGGRHAQLGHRQVLGVWVLVPVFIYTHVQWQAWELGVGRIKAHQVTTAAESPSKWKCSKKAYNRHKASLANGV